LTSSRGQARRRRNPGVGRYRRHTPGPTLRAGLSTGTHRQRLCGPDHPRRHRGVQVASRLGDHQSLARAHIAYDAPTLWALRAYQQRDRESSAATAITCGVPEKRPGIRAPDASDPYTGPCRDRVTTTATDKRRRSAGEVPVWFPSWASTITPPHAMVGSESRRTRGGQPYRR
jgi:hypothetical protein